MSETTPNPKFVRLLRSLLAATRNGRVQWERTVVEDSYRAQFDGTILRLGWYYDEQEVPHPYALLIDPAGKELETAHQTPEHPSLLTDLIAEAQSQVRRRVDTVLDRLIHVVEAGGPGMSDAPRRVGKD